jgi:hypothetical protein
MPESERLMKVGSTDILQAVRKQVLAGQRTRTFVPNPAPVVKPLPAGSTGACNARSPPGRGRF